MRASWLQRCAETAGLTFASASAHMAAERLDIRGEYSIIMGKERKQIYAVPHF